MVTQRTIGFVLLTIAFSIPSFAQLFGTVRVTVRDPQNLAVSNATIIIKDKMSERQQIATTDSDGQALFVAVSAGQYIVSVSASGFSSVENKPIEVTSNTVLPVAIQLAVAGLEQTIGVTDTLQTVNPESSATETLTTRSDILLIPDADRSGSLTMITNNVPGTFVMHDHLHSRGGHGVTWVIDGVPVPNSNLATVGSQFDPKDVAYLEVQRGGLSTNYGDRSYGVFNIIPRDGFEGTRFGEFVGTFGNYHSTNEYLNFGSHTDRFAYFGSLAGSRTDRGLERVDIPVIHDQSASFSGFNSLIFNPSPMNQLRWVNSFRRDHYQVPNTVGQQAIGIRDIENATDGFSNFTWVRTSPTGVLMTISPYYHFNRGEYIGGPSDPLITNDDRKSHYLGGYVNLAVTKERHSARFGTDVFAEHDDSLFSLRSRITSATQREMLWAHVAALFAEDSYKVTPWWTVNGGLRFQQFGGTISEHATTPRLGTAIQIRHVGVLRGSYARYYQHPQTSTISGPILQFALQEGFNFLPVPGERDEVWEVGLAIPFRGWTLDVDRFHNKTRNLVDHEVLGNSNLLFPLTVARGRVQAWESTLRTPVLFKRLQFHYAASYEKAQGRGKVTGGLTDFLPPANDFFFLDHDQRVTLNTGWELTLPRKVWSSGTVSYGSGFLRGNGPAHMPRHTTLDVSAGKDIGENLSLRLTALNLTNELFLTGFENSFAGTHYFAPREVSVQLRYKFHY
jgi:outer membrane receptor protein involved in Fe transport